jgi:phthiodiolone/phenolphthiodiolone dimycocerosates ketoreductase
VSVETAIAVWGDRHLPPAAIQQMGVGLEASGVVDGVLICDQITNFLPRQLWTPENTPMADLMADCDSHPDVFVMAAYLLAAAPSLDLNVSTDSIRRAPAELIQTMLTLSNIAEGRATFQIGGGEIKQTGPTGHPHKQGMSRMKDLFEIFQRVMDTDGPIDYDGRRWKMKNLALGSAKQHRPKLWGLGAGPTLLDHATTYADGLGVTCPPVWGRADAFERECKRIRQMVADKGRDPEAFKIGVWFPVMLARDWDQLDPYLENPLVKWMSGMFGRIDGAWWGDIGMESPIPLDWHYYTDFLPYEVTDAFVDEVISKTTRDHVLECWLSGTPAEVAGKVQDYIDAGADWVCPMDYLPLMLPPEEAEEAFGRSIELCGAIKAANA